MAKKTALPNISKPQEVQVPVDPPADVAAEQEEPANVKVSSAMVEVPLMTMGIGYCKRIIQCRLSRSQAEKLKQIQHGLEAKELTLKNGKAVACPMHAIQWMLENIIA